MQYHVTTWCCTFLFLAAARANASGNGQPYLSTIPRAQMVKHLDEQRDILLRSIGYLESDTVGGDTGLWYDGEEEGPMVTPNPKITSKPKKTPLPQPGPSPEIWSSRSKELLYETLKDKVQEDLNSLELMKSTYGISGALEEVFSNQDIVEKASQKYQVPAAMINTIMFRERLFYDFRDSLADLLVSNGIRKDSSTGSMQIFGATAIRAINDAVKDGITSWAEMGFGKHKELDPHSAKDIFAVWERMNNDDTFCVEAATLNIRLCAKDMLEHSGQTLFDDMDMEAFSPEELIETFSLYNGTGSSARIYGEECYNWYDSFVEYEHQKEYER